MNQMQLKVQEFINKNRGKLLTDPWGTYKGECVSLVKQFCKFMGWPIVQANAYQMPANYPKSGAYKFVKNYWWTVPKVGWIAVFDTNPYGWDWGHTGVVVSGTIKYMLVFNQNWPHGNNKDVAVVTKFDYKAPKCVGFIVKK